MSAKKQLCRIAAEPERVFDYFVQPELLVRWMGDFARLEARDGGIFSVDILGVTIRGHYVQLHRPHLIQIAWGEAGNDVRGLRRVSGQHSTYS